MSVIVWMTFSKQRWKKYYHGTIYLYFREENNILISESNRFRSILSFINVKNVEKFESCFLLLSCSSLKKQDKTSNSHSKQQRFVSLQCDRSAPTSYNMEIYQYAECNNRFAFIIFTVQLSCDQKHTSCCERIKQWCIWRYLHLHCTQQGRNYKKLFLADS